MTYTALLDRLGLDTAGAVASFVGVTERQAYRYQAGVSAVPESVLRLLKLADALGIEKAKTVLARKNPSAGGWRVGA